MAGLWIVGTLVSTLLFPAFRWTTNTLAEVGRAGQPSAVPFDASIVLGSVLGVAFLWGRWSETENVLQRGGIVLIAALIGLVGISQLGLRNPWLELVALTFILATLPALALFGSGDVLAGQRRRGILAVWLGIGHILAWQVISIILGFSSAIPTFVSMSLLSAWILALYATERPTPGIV